MNIRETLIILIAICAKLDWINGIFKNGNDINETHVFLYKKNFYKKMNLKNPKTLRKC